MSVISTYKDTQKNIKLKYFSMFSGIGGFELGLEKSNYAFECIGFSEIDKYAESVYLAHFKDVKNYGDATKIKTEELPDFDFLVGGFPCQAFSVAGKQKGFNDTRGTLFFEIARVLRDKKPRYFLLENVKGLLGHDKGKTFQTILEVINELGYDVSWGVYNSKDYGVPQNRERVFIKGYLRGECGRKVLFNSRVNKTVNKPISNNHKIQSYGNVRNGHQNGGVYNINGISPCLTACSYKDPTKIVQPILTPDRINKKQNGRRIKKDGEPMFTLTTQDKHGIYDGFIIRKITPLECERLQAFPDNWTKYGKDGELISDTQRYKMCGNAVTTTVITFLINEMFDNLPITHEEKDKQTRLI